MVDMMSQQGERRRSDNRRGTGSQRKGSDVIGKSERKHTIKVSWSVIRFEGPYDLCSLSMGKDC